MQVCLAADTIGFPEGGGHLWAYLNWALGLRELGCDVLWHERSGETHGLESRLDALGIRLVQGVEEAAAADLLLSLRYDLPVEMVRRFRRSVLVDIDPGLLQLWLQAGQLSVAQFGARFTTGRVDDPSWQRTTPCVHLGSWPVRPPGPEASFRTVSGWWADEWVLDGEECYRNDKRAGFQPFLDLPRLVDVQLELALALGPGDEDEAAELEARGWRVRAAAEAAGTPEAYREYVATSCGELSAAKPSCVRLRNEWVSDRTLCFLASGKPAVVQDTGAGLPWSFSTLGEAAAALDRVVADYEEACAEARHLAEERFDARRVVASVLERAL